MTEKCFVDTNIFIYARDRSDPKKRKRAIQIITDLWRSGLGAISYQVITEFSAVCSSKFRAPDDAIHRDVNRLLTWSPVPIDSNIIQEGFRLREQYKLSFWDSWIVAAALQAECSKILSEDLADGASYHGTTVNNPFRDMK